MADNNYALFYEEVSKSRKLIRAEIKGENSATANRIMMSLIAQVDYEHPDWDKKYTIRLADLVEKSGIAMNRNNVDEICKAMISTAAGISENCGKRRVWMTFFSKIEYEEGIITARFNKEIQPVLAHLRDFVSFNYLDYLKLNSAYAQQLWELLIMFRKSGNNTPEYDTIQLEDKLGIPQKLRKNFREVKSILNRAKTEIEKKTDLKFVWETDRKYRPTKIIFYMGRTRLPKIEEQEKEKAAEQNEKTKKIQSEWAQCSRDKKDCEHYAKSKKSKCALCRKMGTFAPQNGLFE